MTVVDIHFMGVIMCSQLSLASQVVHPFLFSTEIFVVLFKARRMVVAVDA